jgi:hypothetical protein
LELFHAWRPSPYAGAGPLPFGGGAAEQPAALMRCLYFMAAVAAELDRNAAGDTEKKRG